MAHKMLTTHVGCYRPAVLDGGSNPPISTGKKEAPGARPEPLSCFAPRRIPGYASTPTCCAATSTSRISRSPVIVRWTGHLPAISIRRAR